MKDTNLYTSDWFRKQEQAQYERNVKATIKLLQKHNAEDLIPMVIGNPEEGYYHDGEHVSPLA